MTTKSLSEAVKSVAENLLTSKSGFSIYDITSEIRNLCNSGQLTLSNVSTFNSQNGPRFNVRHVEVKQLFLDMFQNNEFSNLRFDFNPAGYNVYSAVTPSTPAPSTPTPVSTPASVPTPSLNANQSNLIPVIGKYLKNKLSNGQSVTLKQIQSALKRHGNYKCDEIRQLLVSCGYQLTNTSAPVSLQTVV